MSNALPMTDERRCEIGDRDRWTARNYRQLNRMARRSHYRAVGDLPAHGATGEPTRRPLVHVSLPPERGSIRTHVATYCAPCDRHVRPRLHRHPVGDKS